MPGSCAERQAAWVGRVARAYAAVFRAQRADSIGMFIRYGLPPRAFPRGGVTWGDTYLTGAEESARSAERLRHERVHVAQWRRYGLWFVIRYLRAGRDPQRNRYELEAGLSEGGYAGEDVRR